MTETAAKKDVQRLQRTIVDALEDVKALDIRVFNTEHLSPLFERVVVASGNSNRQTKALSASVRDKVRDAGFGKPRIEGEDNGEWIIADCGPVVVHIMQPTIRQYYNLEELWGDKPVRLKFGADKPVAPVKALSKTPAKTGRAPAKTPRARSATAPSSAKPSAQATPAKTVAKTVAKTTAKTPVKTPRASTRSTVKAAVTPAKAPATRKSASVRSKTA